MRSARPHPAHPGWSSSCRIAARTPLLAGREQRHFEHRELTNGRANLRSSERARTAAYRRRRCPGLPPGRGFQRRPPRRSRPSDLGRVSHSARTVSARFLRLRARRCSDPGRRGGAAVRSEAPAFDLQTALASGDRSDRPGDERVGADRRRGSRGGRSAARGTGRRRVVRRRPGLHRSPLGRRRFARRPAGRPRAGRLGGVRFRGRPHSGLRASANPVRTARRQSRYAGRKVASAGMRLRHPQRHRLGEGLLSRPGGHGAYPLPRSSSRNGSCGSPSMGRSRPPAPPSSGTARMPAKSAPAQTAWHWVCSAWTRSRRSPPAAEASKWAKRA